MYSAPPAAIRVAFSAGALRGPWNVERARSSAGEHYVDIVGVTSSILVAPTIPFSPQISLDFAGPFSSSEDDTSAESAIRFSALSSHFGPMKMTLSSLVLRLSERLFARASDWIRALPVRCLANVCAALRTSGGVRDTPPTLRFARSMRCGWSRGNPIPHGPRGRLFSFQVAG